MKPLQELYHMAQQENIVIDRFALVRREALSLMDEDGNCFIAIDPGKIVNEADERSKLAHELGHCMKGAFYNRYSNYDCRQRHENRADKWAISQLVPVDDLDEAVADGCCELWELADRFGITEDMMRKTVCYYVHGNLATELYF